MSFSDLVHSVEHIAEDVLVPRDRPSSVQEAEAVAKAAEGVAVTLDPELEPIFQAIGSVGNTIEGALHDLGVHVGNLKSTLAKRAAAPVAGVPPLTTGNVPVGTPDPAAPQPAASPPPAQPEAVADPNPLEAPADAGASTEATPSPTSAADVPPPPAPPEAQAPAEPAPPTALETAESDFAGLSEEDKAAFETAEGLEATPPPAPPDAAPPA